MDAAIVKIIDLQVFLAQEDDSWIAQAVELDYAACGATEEEARKRFERGLCLTIQEHLDRFNDLTRFIKPAPTQDWIDLATETGAKRRQLTQISVHPLWHPWEKVPFGQIKYHRMDAEAA